MLFRRLGFAAAFLLAQLPAAAPTLAAAPPVAADGHVDVEGRVIAEHGDDVRGGATPDELFLDTGRERLKLRVSGHHKAPAPGSRVRVHGHRNGDTLDVAADGSLTTTSLT